MLLFAFAFALLSCCFPLPLLLLLLVVVFIMYFALFASVLLLTLAIAHTFIKFLRSLFTSLPLSLSLAGFIFRQVLTSEKGQPRYAGIILDILRYSPVSPPRLLVCLPNHIAKPRNRLDGNRALSLL